MSRAASGCTVHFAVLGVLVCATGAIALGFSGCADRRTLEQIHPGRAWPEASEPRVIALGNIRTGRQASIAEAELAQFLFGAEPAPPVSLLKPAGFDQAFSASPATADLLICDLELNAVMRFPAAGGLEGLPLAPLPQKPTGIRLVAGISPPAGSPAAPDLLVVDSSAARVRRYAPDGRGRREYALATAFRPADAIQLEREVWVTNVAAHTIEVFDAETARHARSIGRRGPANGEFGIPLGMAVDAEQHVYVADVLNARVQVFDRTGHWVRNIGGPGDRVGTFGRPKAVAVAPDGNVFVLDAASQRVHAFKSSGRPLLAFGEPAAAAHGLLVPGHIIVSEAAPPARTQLPAGASIAYFVLVSEQINDAGIRVFAWLSGQPQPSAVAFRPAAARVNAAGTRNPHASAEPADCAACHVLEAGKAQPIAAGQVDRICISCHDGRKAWAEAHPIGRPAREPDSVIPAGWPALDGRLGCLTCHRVHPATDPAIIPPENPAFVRAFDPERPMDFCAKCHTAQRWRENPHRQLADGAVNWQTCGQCHQSMPAETMRRDAFKADLLTGSSNLCLTCHRRHWDFSPQGHVERSLPAEMVRRLAAPPSESTPSPDPRDRTLAASPLPLRDRKVTCFTCHNPHDANLLLDGAKVGTHAGEPEDARVALRLDRVKLCFECHGK